MNEYEYKIYQSNGAGHRRLLATTFNKRIAEQIRRASRFYLVVEIHKVTD